MSYTNLIADVPSFTARGDLTTAQLQRFISLCEDKVSRMVRVAEMRGSVSQVGYCDPAITEIVFKTPNEVLEPITIRAKDSAGVTLRTYEQTPNASFREGRQAKSSRPMWTPDPITAIQATKYDGSTFGGTASAVTLTDRTGLVFCCTFRLSTLPTTTTLFAFPQLNDNDGFSVSVNSSGGIVLETYSTADQITHTFSDFTVSVDTWYSLLLSIDAANSVVIARLNDTKSADSPTFANTDAIALNGKLVSIGALNSGGGNGVSGALCNIGLATYGASAASPLTLFFDADRAATRRRVTDASNVPVQYGTTRGYEVFGTTPLIWIPDGSCNKNFGSIKNIRQTAGEPLELYDTSANFGVVSNLFGAHINPAYGDGTEFFELEYYQEFPRLTTTNDTHWLASNHYDLYLYGCLAEAYDFLQNEAQESRYREKFAGVAAAINRASGRKLRGTGPYVRKNTRRSTP